MADAPDNESAAPADDGRGECRACRGTGKVISNLGGEAKTVDCPWCEGTGTFNPGHDAQAAKRGDDAPGHAEAEVD